MTRGEFIKSAGATVAWAAVGRAFGESVAGVPLSVADYAALQAEIDEVTPKDFAEYNAGGEGRKTAIRRLDDAFGKVLAEVKSTAVADKPAVWLVYNMGVIVKSSQCCFAIDLKHRRAPEIAPLLDFALITHNHGDHYTEELYQAMNGSGKTVISNFKDNYGAHFRKSGTGGYTRVPKVFKIKDVEIRTSLTDHNGYLVDFTTAFEIHVGKYTLLHTGDCANIQKVTPSRRPDLWIVHPRCGTNVGEAVSKLNPALTALAHLNELGHARNRWRWTWQDGLEELKKVEAAGGKGLVPVWGQRIF